MFVFLLKIHKNWFPNTKFSFGERYTRKYNKKKKVSYFIRDLPIFNNFVEDKF